MQLPDERHRNAVEAVASAEAVDESELRAEKLRAAAETRNRAGDNEARQHVPPDGNAVEAAGCHVIANRAQPETRVCPEEHIVENETNRNRNYKAPCKAHAGDNAGKMHRLVDGRRLRNGRVSNPAGVDDAHKKRRDVVEHDGDDHLVLPARDF